LPDGTKYVPLKDIVLKDAFDEYLARIVCFCFSISPQPFVSQTNRATAETAKAQATEEGLGPVLNWFKRLIDQIVQRHLGFAGLEFVWIDDREMDPSAADAIDVADVKAGIRTINEVRMARGLDPLPGGDKLMVATGTGYVPVTQDGAAMTQTPAPRQRPQNAFGKSNPNHWPGGSPDHEGGRFAPKGEGDDPNSLFSVAIDALRTTFQPHSVQPSGDDPGNAASGLIEVAANGPFVPRPQTANPTDYNPLDPTGLNKPLTPGESQAVTDTLNTLINGAHAEVSALHPHPYLNRPTPTGAVLPPALKGYTTFDVNLGTKGPGAARLIIDNATGAMYYTNNHYLTFYRWNLTP
jgi:hypothetical protein